MTSELEEDLEVNWANTRMRQVLLNDVGYTYANARLKSNYCPKCTKHRMVHDDNACNMRYEEESNATGRNNSQRSSIDVL